VEFSREYNDPIVVAFINSRRGGQSVSARIRSVTSSSFELFMQEPDNQNHADEYCSWMVMERGRHTLEGGVVVEAGSLDTDKIHVGGQGFTSQTTNPDDIYFQVAFAEPRPAVLHSLMTHNNTDWMASLVTNVRSDGMKIALEAAESGKTSPGETIGFIAMSTGIGVNNGNPFHIGVANDGGAKDGVTDSPHVIDFGTTFVDPGLDLGTPRAPDVVVSLYGEGGTDGSWARGSGVWSEEQQQVYAEEDQVKDSERGHVDETFAWAAFPPNSKIVADPAGSAVASGSFSGAALPLPRCGDGLCEGDEAQTCPGDCIDYSSSAPPVGAPTTEAPFECADIESSNMCQSNGQCIWHRAKKTCCAPETGPGTSCSSSADCCSDVCRGNGTCL